MREKTENYIKKRIYFNYEFYDPDAGLAGQVATISSIQKALDTNYEGNYFESSIWGLQEIIKDLCERIKKLEKLTEVHKYKEETKLVKRNISKV